MNRTVAAVLISLSLSPSACAPTPPPGPAPGPELNAFLHRIETALERHAWESVLTAADPEHRRIQVERGGMGEPQYVAELLGLHRVGNDIGRGHGISATDLERIREVRFEEVEEGPDRYTARGTAVLDDGSTLEVRALVVRRSGEFRLTGGVG